MERRENIVDVAVKDETRCFGIRIINTDAAGVAGTATEKVMVVKLTVWIVMANTPMTHAKGSGPDIRILRA